LYIFGPDDFEYKMLNQPLDGRYYSIQSVLYDLYSIGDIARYDKVEATIYLAGLEHILTTCTQSGLEHD
jgi:hypothetical protein